MNTLSRSQPPTSSAHRCVYFLPIPQWPTSALSCMYLTTHPTAHFTIYLCTAYVPPSPARGAETGAVRAGDGVVSGRGARPYRGACAGRGGGGRVPVATTVSAEGVPGGAQCPYLTLLYVIPTLPTIPLPYLPYIILSHSNLKQFPHPDPSLTLFTTYPLVICCYNQANPAPSPRWGCSLVAQGQRALLFGGWTSRCVAGMGGGRGEANRGDRALRPVDEGIPVLDVEESHERRRRQANWHPLSCHNLSHDTL